MRIRIAVLLLAGVVVWNFCLARELTVSIAPGSLQQALEGLSQLTGLQILYDPSLVQGRVTQGLTGTMEPKAALTKLLAETDIAFSFTGDDAVALFRRTEPLPASGVPHPAGLHTVTVSADRAAAGSYDTNTSLAATKVDEASLIVPLASQSLTQAILRDRQVDRLEDALEYISASEVAPTGQSAVGFQLRGMPTYQYYLDGVRVSPDLHHDGFRDMANIERIEVVKGPASLLYGRTEPGGAINLITKQPLTQPQVTWEQQGGSFGHKRTELDAGGPVAGEPDVFYRFNAAYEDQDSFRQRPSRRIFLAPVLDWKVSETTTGTLYAEFLNSHDFHDSGLPVVGTHLPPVPVGRSLETGSEVHTTDFRLGAKGSHTFADGWTLNLHLDTRWTQSPRSPGVAISDDGIDDALCTSAACPVQRALVSIPASHGSTYFLSADAQREIKLWSTRHSLLMGLDLFQSMEYSELLTRSDPSLATSLFHPQPATVPLALLASPDWDSRDTTTEGWAGLYVQDQMQVTDSLYVLAGMRFDYVQERINNFAYETNILYPGWYDTGGGNHNTHSSRGRGGVLWHPTPTLSLYVNYIENFGVNAGLYYSSNNNSQGLTFIPDATAHEWETGLKLETSDGRASASIAFFNLTKRNIATPILEPAISNTSYQFVMNGATNRGVEIDFHGEVTPGLQLLASYALINSRIDNYVYRWYGPTPKGYEQVGFTGNRLAGVPRHGASLWMTYRVAPDSALRGLKFGVGAVARGVREGDNANDYQLPAFVRLSGVAAYAWQGAGANYTLQLNADNLFDKRCFESLNGTRTVVPGTPRTWLASIIVAF